MARFPRIPPAVARKLGYYVYVYVDPFDNSVFYIGKGQNNRALAHLNADEKRTISKRIRSIQARGRQPRIDILAHKLPNADTALRIEAAAIDLLGTGKLTNTIRGWQGDGIGRTSIDHLVAHYTRRSPKFKEPVMLIRINQLYHFDMSPQELYDATRSAWRLGSQRANIKLAMAVYQGVIREVYQITGWFPAGSTFNSRSSGRRKRRSGRTEFVGVVAEDSSRRRYLGKYVGDRFPRGDQNPVRYVFPNSPVHGRKGK